MHVYVDTKVSTREPKIKQEEEFAPLDVLGASRRT